MARFVLSPERLERLAPCWLFPHFEPSALASDPGPGWTLLFDDARRVAAAWRQQAEVTEVWLPEHLRLVLDCTETPPLSRISSPLPAPVARAHHRRAARPVLAHALGALVLHGSGVLGGQGVVGLIGRCGSGKSTLAAGLARGGRPQVAEDALVLAPTAGQVKAWVLPARPRLSRESRMLIRRVPRRRGLWKRPRIAPLAALWLLRAAERDECQPVELRHLSPAQAFEALMPHCYGLEAGAEPEHQRGWLWALLEVAARVPVAELHLRWGREFFAEAVEQLAAKLG